MNKKASLATFSAFLLLVSVILLITTYNTRIKMLERTQQITETYLKDALNQMDVAIELNNKCIEFNDELIDKVVECFIECGQQ